MWVIVKSKKHSVKECPGKQTGRGGGWQLLKLSLRKPPHFGKFVQRENRCSRGALENSSSVKNGYKKGSE